MKHHWSKDLPPDACGEAVDWCKTQPSLKVAWKKCEDGGWMIWLLLRRRIKNSKKKLRLLAADIAESVFDLVQDDHKLAAAWAIAAARRGDEEECDAAAYAAYAADAAYAAYAAANASYAAYAAYAAYDAYAANAAAYAADAAYAAYIAADAAYIAAAAAAANAAAYAAYAAGSTHKKIVADLVREHFPNPPRLKGGKDKKKAK